MPLGFVNNKSAAELIRSRIIRDFVRDGTAPGGQYPPTHFSMARQGMAALYDPEEWERLQGHLSTDEEAKVEKQWKRAKELAEQELKDLLHHPLRRGKRKEFAEKHVRTFKAPGDFQPSKESVVSGGLPTEDNTSSAWEDSERPEYKRQFDKDLDVRRAGTAKEEFIQDAARTVTKRLKAEEEGQDPEKLVDDIRIASFPLSCRQAINNLASGCGSSRTEVCSHGNG